MSRALSPPAAPARGLKQVGRFARHYVEMCAAMCIGCAVGDALYFWLASLAGYPKPFSELPVLSVVPVTVFMTAPMTAWMLYRGMPRWAIIDMSAAMPILPIGLLALGWIGRCPWAASRWPSTPDDAGHARPHAAGPRPLHRSRAGPHEACGAAAMKAISGPLHSGGSDRARGALPRLNGQ
jgi:hypothetical protein